MNQFQVDFPTIYKLAQCFAVLWPFYIAGLLGWWIAGNDEVKKQAELRKDRLARVMARTWVKFTTNQRK